MVEWTIDHCFKFVIFHEKQGRPYPISHLKLIVQSKVIETDRVEYAKGVLHTVFTIQLDIIRQNDYNVLIPTYGRH